MWGNRSFGSGLLLSKSDSVSLCKWIHCVEEWEFGSYRKANVAEMGNGQKLPHEHFRLFLYVRIDFKTRTEGWWKCQGGEAEGWCREEGRERENRRKQSRGGRERARYRISSRLFLPVLNVQSKVSVFELEGKEYKSRGKGLLKIIRFTISWIIYITNCKKRSGFLTNTKMKTSSISL